MIRFKHIMTVSLAFVTIHCYGQISTWNEKEMQLPGGGDNGIISYIDKTTDKDMSSGVFESWDKVLGEFGEESVLSNTKVDSMANNVMKLNGTPRHAVTFNGQTLNLPTAIDENGIDLYLLTEEGINIYMALSAPAFYQDIDADTKKWIRFYAYSKRVQTETMFKRFAEWEPRIRTCFDDFGVPPELAVLCLVESACTYGAVSKAGAVGMWQFMPDTALEFGLVVNASRDDRLDPVFSTTAAAKMLYSMNRDIKDWTLTMAAYNCGKARITGKTKRHGTKDWQVIKKSLPEETRQYIPAIIAIYYIWTYREQLGFKI